MDDWASSYVIAACFPKTKCSGLICKKADAYLESRIPIAYRAEASECAGHVHIEGHNAVSHPRI